MMQYGPLWAYFCLYDNRQTGFDNPLFSIPAGILHFAYNVTDSVFFRFFTSVHYCIRFFLHDNPDGYSTPCFPPNDMRTRHYIAIKIAPWYNNRYTSDWLLRRFLMPYHITVLPQKQNIETQPGETLLEALRHAGFAPDAPGSGIGTCG